MWGFSSRKDQDDSAAPTEMANDAKQSSPTKRSARRRMGRRRGSDEANNNEHNKAGGKVGGALNFARGGKAQGQTWQSEQALRSSNVINQKESTQQSDQQQDINVDATDSQGIEILLDYSAVRKKNQNNPNEDNPKSPPKHHSRRSMSNRAKDKRRSAPPTPNRSPHHSSSLAVPAGDISQPVISLERDILIQRTKIYRAQFSVIFPIRASANSDPNSPFDPHKPHHRIPLGGRRLVNDLSYNDVVKLLQQANPLDEVSAVKTELKKITAEMDALADDKYALERKWASLKQQQKASGKQGASPITESIDWDIHRLLNSNRKLSNQERAELEKKRGRCVTAYFTNPRSTDAFINKCCGAKTKPPKLTRRKIAAVTLEPGNCKLGGAAATIRHLSLLPKGSSFFVSRDTGQSYSFGQLPPRLFHRMKKQGMDPFKVCGDLSYLSSGPNGYYYAEFRSGECWWGCAGEDKEFYDILQKWDIYRVVFGSTMTHSIVDDKDQTREIITNSWIILGRDGRAAWKNLPSRLHQTLGRRLANSAAPAEIALGSGDSYYIRFLDGIVDYCLPAELASVCSHIQRGGGSLTDMSLNPEVSHEFMLRHT